MNPDTKDSMTKRIIEPLSAYYGKKVDIKSTGTLDNVELKIDGLDSTDIFCDICEGKTGLNVYIISQLILDKSRLEVGLFTNQFARIANTTGKRSDRFQRIYVDSKGKSNEYHPTQKSREVLKNEL
jgi:hypothetical protein